MRAAGMGAKGGSVCIPIVSARRVVVANGRGCRYLLSEVYEVLHWCKHVGRAINLYPTICWHKTEKATSWIVNARDYEKFQRDR